jgi:penicillin G amidase
MRYLRVALYALIVSSFACGGETPSSTDVPTGSNDTASELGVGDTSKPDAIEAKAEARAAVLAIDANETWQIPGLIEPVHVVRVEKGIPHIYATSTADLGRALGFTVARDRFMIMDLQRRLGTGTLSALLGDAGLSSDMESRYMGMTHTTDVVHESLSEETAAYIDAFVAGVNAYTDEVKKGTLAAPSELEIFAPILGYASAGEMMTPFVRRDVAAMTAVIMYETNFETGDPGRQQKQNAMDTLFDGVFGEALRKAGAKGDIWDWVKPPYDVASASGWGLQKGESLGLGDSSSSPTKKLSSFRPQERAMESTVLQRAVSHLDSTEKRFMRDKEEGFGSNAWAVSSKHTTTGAALVAGDGHLPLYMPSIMYQIGMNTDLFGGGDVHQVGLLITSLPVLAVGTNGHVAWSQVNPVTDNTDWYREELQLGADGYPSESSFQGDWKALKSVEETYAIADVPALGSVGREETWTRYTTFDGRWIYSIEGQTIATMDEAEEGAAVVNVMGDLVIPGDTDGDGVITAVSFDWAGFDSRGYIESLMRTGKAKDVEEVRDLHRGQIGGGLYTAAADSSGSILFSGYLAIPCRTNLERDEDGVFKAGSDPTMLLDGTTLGGFEIPTGADGLVDESAADVDVNRCVVPMSETPQAIDPPQGYVVTANNQPAPITDDNKLMNEPWYIGGPWSSIRADSIAAGLEATVSDKSASVATMADIQGFRRSRLGEIFTTMFLSSIDRARTLSEEDGPKEDWESRLADLYSAKSTAVDEVQQRLQAWMEAGYDTPSGVETFYNSPAEGDGENAVATMLFNAWLPRVMAGVFNDENMGAAFRYNGSRTRLRALERFVRSRGENVDGIASFNPETKESIFFDVLGTDELERSDEVVLAALVGTLDFLSGPTTNAGSKSGFNTEDMSQWLWGLRHQVRFRSLLADFLGDNPAFAFLADTFSLTTETLPLAQSMSGDDPRKKLVWFPRGGDNYAVDAANGGFGGSDFTYGSGPVMRMVIALKDGEVWGQNIVPGGQSGVLDAAHHHDQAGAWLGNETVPLRFHPKDVVEGAVSREELVPMSP